MKTEFKDIDKHSSILIIGIGKKKKHLFEIVQPRDFDEMLETFGACTMTSAYIEVADMKDDIYVMNIETKHDYIKAATIIRKFEFSMVVPVSMNFYDYFYDPLENGRKTYYIQYMLQKCSRTKSVFIATTPHASLYEDIDSFLDDIRNENERFHANIRSNEHRENLIVVANNLKNVESANIVLAGMIAQTPVSQYPKEYQEKTLEAIFSIDKTDQLGDIAYFKSHMDGSTTVENLLNMYPASSPIKIFTIYRICLYIMKELDYSDYIGSMYTPYKKLSIRKLVEDFLTSLLETLLIDFKITQCFAEEDPGHPGAVVVVVNYEIQPIGFVEGFLPMTLRVS